MVVENDRLETVLAGVRGPVLRILNRLVAVLRHVGVEVDRLATVLLVVLKPVDKELNPLDRPPTLVDKELIPVEVDVDSDEIPVDKLLLLVLS